MKTQTLNEKLKILRESKGFSQEYVAEQLNISRQAISKWETGKTYPEVDNLILLSNLYEISLDELLNSASITFDSKKKSKNYKNQPDNRSPNIEMLFLSILVVMSCLFQVIGILVPISILIWMQKNKKHYLPVFIISILCLLISLYNSFVFLNQVLFHIGEVTIEKI